MEVPVEAYDNSGSKDFNLNRSGESTGKVDLGHYANDISISISSYNKDYDDGVVILYKDGDPEPVKTIDINSIYTAADNADTTIRINDGTIFDSYEVKHTGDAKGKGKDSQEFKIGGAVENSVISTEFVDQEVQIPFEDSKIVTETFTNTREYQVLDYEAMEAAGIYERDGEYFQNGTQITGTDGNDMIEDTDGIDIIDAGAGHDNITFDGSDTVLGGDGLDNLIIEEDMNFDFDSLAESQVSNIEGIILGDGVQNITLDTDDVKNLTDASSDLGSLSDMNLSDVLSGLSTEDTDQAIMKIVSEGENTSSDKVTLEGGWTNTGQTVTENDTVFDVYTNDDASSLVFVDKEIDVDI